MRTFYVSLAAVSALAIAFPSFAAEKPRAAQTSPSTQTKKVWTNEDMDQLRARGLITTFNPAPEMIAQAPTVAPEPARFGPRTADPAWFADEASMLQAELDRREAALREAQANLALAQDRITQPGINMYEGNVGITPAAGIAILEARVHEVQDQLDELSDLARRSNIPPGVLRG